VSSSPSFIVKSRCGVYYARFVIPAQQRDRDTPREIRLTTGSKDPRHARAAARYARVVFDMLIAQNHVISVSLVEQLKKRMTTRKPQNPPIPFNAHQDDSGKWHITDIKPGDPPVIADFYEAMEKFSGTALSNVAIENAPSIHEPGRLSPESRKKVARMVVEYLKYEAGREKEKEIGVKKVPQIKTRLKPFLEHFSSKQIGTLTPEDIELFRGSLQYYPANIHRLASTVGLTFDEIIEKSKNKVLLDENGKRAACITGLTIDGYMQVVRNFLIFCKKRYAINPALIDDFSLINKSKHEKKGMIRKAFNKEHLQRIFGSEYYREALYNTSYQYWLPVLAAFTGARINEIAQLLPSDVKKDDDGLWYIDITDSADDGEEGKSLKNEESRRIVPVHEKLITLGFIDFVEDQKVKGAKNLFDINPAKSDKYGKLPSEWFNQKYLRKYLKIEDKRLVFHSFRHLMISKLGEKIADDAGLPADQMLRSKAPEPIILRRMVGHSVAHAFTRGRGEDIHLSTYTGAFSIKIMKRLIDKLDYEGVHFFKYKKIEEGKRRRVMLKQAPFEVNGDDLVGLL